MFRALLAAAALTVLASPAAAQRDDRIELFTDENLTACGLTDMEPGYRAVYMVHAGSLPAAASQFVARRPDCWTGAVWLGDEIASPFLSIGNSQTDLSVAYTICRVPPIVIGRIDYFVAGTAPSCCVYPATAAPQALPPGILVVGCFFETFVVEAGPGVIINPNENCPCDVPPPPPPPAPSKIEIFADEGGTSCEIVDHAPGLRSVHLFHTGGSEGVTASQFAAPRPPCWTGATWIGDFINPEFLFIGTSQSDLSVAYRGCVERPIYIGRIDFAVTGAAPACCRYPVISAPSALPPAILDVDCEFRTRETGANPGVTINPTADCPCGAEPPLRVERAMWGRVKALYRSGD